MTAETFVLIGFALFVPTIVLAIFTEGECFFFFTESRRAERRLRREYDRALYARAHDYVRLGVDPERAKALVASEMDREAREAIVA